MRLTFTPEAWEEHLYWQEYDKQVRKKVNKLIKEILRDPFTGIGKPEPLKYEFQGCWSRRITDEHRIVYEVLEHEIIIISCKYHY